MLLIMRCRALGTKAALLAAVAGYAQWARGRATSIGRDEQQQYLPSKQLLASWRELGPRLVKDAEELVSFYAGLHPCHRPCSARVSRCPLPRVVHALLRLWASGATNTLNSYMTLLAAPALLAHMAFGALQKGRWQGHA
jgi:hypothetical protein